jgi:O-antigen ligase
VAASDWNFCAIALGVLLATGYLGREGVPAPASPLLYGSIFAIPLWALLQTIPLPVALVSVLSPERVALAKPLLRFGLMPGVLSLSIQPDASLQYAIRYLAFGAAFLIARDLMWRLPARPGWWRCWKETLRVVAAYPFTGCGFGAFGSAVTPFRQTAAILTLDYAHNDYLQFLAEGGIVPFIFALIVCVIVIRAALLGVLRPAPLEAGDSRSPARWLCWRECCTAASI